ncbi:hypothetical protein BOX15_Mlig014630g2 [Macrostomum lignano]|uniref:Arrestin C-terminal-like domain-containing protein n=2 Tax=Macrostomum lignano TaxID=282301 RepID=A0A267GLW6_9PLAT|nr:hypothetical protein BOX15_Mlig014630g2 [Macrostomum lignano]
MGCEMAKLRRLDISLDNSLGIYSPGDRVTGFVCVDVTEPTEVHGGRMWFYGNAETSWVEITKSEGAETVTGHQVFFQTCCQLFGKELDDNSESPGFVIGPGFHQFPFQFQLPEQLPSSFEYYSETGRIKARVSFSVKAEVENSRRTASHSRERPILIINFYDLNVHRHLIDRVCLKKEIALACLCISKGRIVCELSLSKTGYVPGETMDISVHLFNSSTSCVKSTHITFQQRVFLSAGLHRKVASALIFSISGQRVKPGASGYYHDVIHIPPLPPSGMPHCEIIDIEYLVQVQIEAAGAFRQTQMLELSLPVIIGNVPLRDSFIDNKQVVPCYAHFDFNTGDIVEHNAGDLESASGPVRPVYTYYKTERKALLGSAHDGSGGGGGGGRADCLADMSPERRRLLKQRSCDVPQSAHSTTASTAAAAVAAAAAAAAAIGRFAVSHNDLGRNGTITAI